MTMLALALLSWALASIGWRCAIQHEPRLRGARRWRR